MLFLGAMMVMLVVAGGVAFALLDCTPDNYCDCQPGVLCEGTNDARPGYWDAIYGTETGDNIYAYAGDDEIQGRGGNDYVEAGPGDDWIYGGEGDDTLIGGSGNDTIWGGDGYDQCYGDTGANENPDDSCEKWVPPAVD
jgi:hypothetical protein